MVVCPGRCGLVSERSTPGKHPAEHVPRQPHMLEMVNERDERPLFRGSPQHEKPFRSDWSTQSPEPCPPVRVWSPPIIGEQTTFVIHEFHEIGILTWTLCRRKQAETIAVAVAALPPPSAALRKGSTRYCARRESSGHRVKSTPCASRA
jgi:hypothetical protein